MNKFEFKNFFELTRGYTLFMSIIPLLIVFILYVTKTQVIGIYPIIKGIMLFLGVEAIHMFANLFDDYIDIKNKLNQNIPLNQIDFHSKRKARTILNGTFSITDVEKILITLGLISVFVGIFFILSSEANIIPYIILGAILTLFYPFSSKYGLSETVIALVFGPILINGAHCALIGGSSTFINTISITMGLMISILSITHSIMDYEYDKPRGKKTLPVMIGKEGAITVIAGLIIISLLFALCLFSQISTFLGVIALIPFAFVAFVSVKFINSLIDYINIKNVQFIPKWYFGIMENWEEIKNAHFEYYMYRFYIARNLAVFFGLSIILLILFIYMMVKLHPFLSILLFPNFFDITNIIF